MSVQRIVEISSDAAGFGWFVDTTPSDDVEFSDLGLGTELVGTEARAHRNVDLLTVVIHELGHVFGLKDLTPTDSPNQIMTGIFATGLRRLPAVDTLLEGQRSVSQKVPGNVVGYSEGERKQSLVHPVPDKSESAALSEFFARHGVLDGIVFRSFRQPRPNQSAADDAYEAWSPLEHNHYSTEVERVFSNSQASWLSHNLVDSGGLPEDDMELLLGDDAELVVSSAGTELNAILR